MNKTLLMKATTKQQQGKHLGSDGVASGGTRFFFFFFFFFFSCGGASRGQNAILRVKNPQIRRI